MRRESVIRMVMTFTSSFEQLADVESMETQPLLGKGEISSIHDEFRIILLNALPLIATFFLQGSILSMPLIFVGRLGPLQLGGVAMANIIVTVCLAVFLGLGTSLDTLCPQAYGAKKYKHIGLYFQRSVILSILVAVPIILIWLRSAYILAWFVDDSDIVAISSDYLRLMTFSVPGFIIFECGKRYFQAQNDFITGQYILFFCTPLNGILSYLMVLRFQFGYIGACYSLIITYNLMGLITLVSIYLSHRNAQVTNPELDCWHEFSTEVFRNWGPMVRLSAPAVIMIESEFIAFEFLSFLSVRFGTTALAAQSIASTIESFFFQIPFSVGVAASNRIAFHIGQGKVKSCETATKCTLLYFGSALSFLNFAILTLLRYPICRLFTNDPGVVTSAVGILSIVGINQFWDVFNVLGAACLRAQGRQKIGGYLSICAYYAIGMPLACLLGFKLQLEVRGFWMGLGIGIFILAAGELLCVYNSNWRKIIKTVKRMHDK